jgi:DNA-binding CsgD family transcriptional regulator
MKLSHYRQLTAREGQVLALIVGGSTNKVGGAQLGISPRTFEIHRANIMRKIGARNAADLVRMILSDLLRRTLREHFEEGGSIGLQTSPGADHKLTPYTDNEAHLCNQESKSDLSQSRGERLASVWRTRSGTA